MKPVLMFLLRMPLTLLALNGAAFATYGRPVGPGTPFGEAIAVIAVAAAAAWLFDIGNRKGQDDG
jgi:hypothetical protein